MRKLLTILAAGFAFALCAAPSFAAELYEDPATGQIYTKPGEGRVPVVIPDEKAGALYEDPESGAVFSKPAPGRVAVIEPAIETTPQATAVQAPPSKDEVFAVLPSWMQKIKFAGDLRLRYQYQDRPGTPSGVTATPRHRARYRLRFGAEAEVVKSVKVGLQLASGSADRRSTNQTFDSFFNKNDIRIDLAYAAFKPFDELSITGGRMKNPLFTPSDMLWDTDVNPVGGAVNFAYQTEMPVELFFNGAMFILTESSGTNKDPYMYVLQPGVKWDITNKASLKLAGAYYGFDDLETVNTTTITDRSGNNTIAGNRFVYDYDSYALSGELAYKNPVPGILPYAAVFGEFVHAFDPEENNEGWIAGVKLGSEKIAGRGDWSVRYTYRRLEKDAFVDFLPDSDFFEGNTGVSGSEVLVALGLMKNTWLELDYYRTREIRRNIDEDLFQADINFKF